MFDFFLIGYVGPETIMPLASAFAAIAGVIMIGWRYIAGTVLRIVAVFGGDQSPESDVPDIDATIE